MKTKMRFVFILLVVFCCSSRAVAQVSAFTYQGRFNVNGAPANGLYDFMFRLMNDPTNGAPAPVIPINLGVSVSNGLFTTGVDFGTENFDGTKLWLEVNVRPNSGGNFTVLSPRQLLASTPYAIRASSASNLFGTLPAAQISGTILNASLPASPNYSGTVTANFFSGNGGGLTNVSALTLGGLTPSNFWNIGGNAGTTPGSHFLGTTDSKALEFKVNDQRAFRLEPTTPGAPNVIGGAEVNYVAPGVYGATISGGGASSGIGFLGGPETNSISANFGTIGGGWCNTIEARAPYGTIGGGSRNTIEAGSIFGVLDSSRSTIAGGEFNTIQTDAYRSSIGGGGQNTIQTNAADSTISGGIGNKIETRAWHSTIGGGLGNTIQSNSLDSSIGGGESNTIEPLVWRGTIGGGSRNRIENAAIHSTIAGGELNSIKTNAYYSAIAGGRANSIGSDATRSSVGGGESNSCNGAYGTIIGGRLNTIQTNTLYSAIVGGYSNTVAGSYATASGGTFNEATGNYSFAAGRRAKANQDGAFVWSDSSDSDFSSTATNEFAVRATGGVRFVSGIDTNGAPVAGVSLPTGSGSWASLSDRNAKTDFTPLNSRDTLERLARVPIQSWRYKTEADSIRHIGPVAQDFRAAFNLGADARHIATVDADGVALAAIQGLNEKLAEKDAEIQTLKMLLARLEKKSDERESRLARLENAFEGWNGRPTVAVKSGAGD